MEYDLRQESMFQPIYLMQRDHPFNAWVTVAEFSHKQSEVARHVLETLRAAEEGQ